MPNGRPTDRRRGLFGHRYEGIVLGANIMFNMDAQVDYLVRELGSGYSGSDRVLRRSGVTVNDACDEVLYNFEIPAIYPVPNRGGFADPEAATD